MATSTVKIRTAKAIDLLKDSIKIKKTDLTTHKKLLDQYNKDYKVWCDKVVKEAQKVALTKGKLMNSSSSKVVRVEFNFEPSVPAPKAPEQYVMMNDNKNYQYRVEKVNYLEQQIQKAESLLTMLQLTEDEFVSAAVYKDISSMI